MYLQQLEERVKQLVRANAAAWIIDGTDKEMQRLVGDIAVQAYHYLQSVARLELDTLSETLAIDHAARIIARARGGNHV